MNAEQLEKYIKSFGLMPLHLFNLSHDDRREIVEKYNTGAIKLRTREFMDQYAQHEWDKYK